MGTRDDHVSVPVPKGCDAQVYEAFIKTEHINGHHIVRLEENRYSLAGKWAGDVKVTAKVVFMVELVN